MRSFILINLLLLFISCRKDDSAIPCKATCYIAQGQVVTNDGKGISGIPISLEYKTKNGLFNSYRVLAKGKTNNRGQYRIQGAPLEEEIDSFSSGYFQLRMRFKDVNRNVLAIPFRNNPDSKVNYDYSESYLDLYTMDTVLNKSLFIPKVSSIKLNVKNFDIQNTSNYLRIYNRVKVEDNPEQEAYMQDKLYYRGGGLYLYPDYKITDTTVQITAYADLYNNITIEKKKDGQITEEHQVIYVPKDNAIEINVSF